MGQAHDWYTNHPWRDAYTEETIRHLSKTGTLGADEVLFELASVLTKEDVIRFYEALLLSRRSEREWRGEFLSIFTSVQDGDLPPVSDDATAGDAIETPGYFRPPRMPLNIQSDEDIPY